MLFKLFSYENTVLATANGRMLGCIKKIDFSWQDGDGEPKIEIEFDREKADEAMNKGAALNVGEDGFVYWTGADFDLLTTTIEAADAMKKEGKCPPKTKDDVTAFLSRLRSLREERSQNLTAGYRR